MGKTPIEWVRNAAGEQGHSINPIRFRNLATGKGGHHCEKISPGCKNCYASTMNGGPYLSGLTYIAENTPKGEYFLDENALQQALRRRKPTAYFWCDMTDMFGSWVPDEWIDRCFAVMALTPQHRHFVLTKRADRMREYFGDEEEGDARDLVMRWGAAAGELLDGEWIWNEGKRYRKRIDRFISHSHGFEDDDETQVSAENAIQFPLPNVWLGVSVEDQQRADERIAHLLATPAAVRFLSVEPMLGPVDLLKAGAMHMDYEGDPSVPGGCHHFPMGDVGWVIVGGESGPGARPMHPDWARSLRDQCNAAGVAFFFKQWGEWIPSEKGRESHLRDGHSIKLHSVGPERCRWLYPDGTSDRVGEGDVRRGTMMMRVGKQNADRLLDGREWNELPEANHG